MCVCAPCVRVCARTSAHACKTVCLTVCPSVSVSYLSYAFIILVPVIAIIIVVAALSNATPRGKAALSLGVPTLPVATASQSPSRN